MQNSNIRILHLEDQPLDAERIKWLLKKGNIESELKVVETREDFEKALIEFKPEIILSDHNLPAFDSMDALDILKASGLRIPFILVTGTVSEEFAVEAMKAGAADYLLKDRPQRLPIAILGALEKYRLKEERKKTETQLRNIDANSLDVICIIDNEGRFVHVSAASTSVWGYSPSELTGRKFMDFVFEEDREITSQMDNSIMSGNAVTMFENRYVHKNGSIVPILWSSRWDETEKLVYCVAKDATEKKRMEQSLKSEQQRFMSDQLLARTRIEESKKQYVQLVHNLHAAVYTCDAEGYILLYNKAAVKLWGRSPIIGKDKWSGSWKIFDAAGVELSRDALPMTRVIKEGISIDGEEVITERQDGTRRNVIQYPSPDFDATGKVIGAVNMLIDVTDQKKIEVENRKLALIASLTLNAVIVTDAAGKISWINDGFERITEYSFDEVVGKKPGEFLQGPETDPESIRQMHTYLEQGKSFRLEVLNYSKSGRKYWLDIEVMPLYDHRQRLTGFMAIEQNITDRKKTELESVDLINRLQKRNSDLQQFSYIVSHNLRAPIAKILGLASIMDSDNPDENKFLINKIVDEANQLDNVVNDINTIVSARKSKKEKMELVHFETELNLIKQVLETKIIESNAIITSDFSKYTGTLTIKSFIYSIIYNLVSNAIKYRQPGVPLNIHLQSTEDEKYLCLSVRDNGRGIDLVKNGHKIFGLYRRFDSGNIPGKGIGLNLVKTHAETLGGKVEVESNINEGTVFKVYLPKTYDDNSLK